MKFDTQKDTFQNLNSQSHTSYVPAASLALWHAAHPDTLMKKATHHMHKATFIFSSNKEAMKQ